MSKYFNDAFAEGRDLTEESANFEPVLYRDELLPRIINILARRKSVLLVGPNGVGKTRIVHEIARQFRSSGRSRLYEFSVAQLLSGTKFLGEWESKVSKIIDGAVQKKGVIYFSDIWGLPTAGRSSNREGTAWDFIRPQLERNRLQLIGEVSEDQLQSIMQFKGFSTLFETVEIPPLSREAMRDIVSGEASRLKLGMDQVSLSRVLELCDQFLATADGPGPALGLLLQVRDYKGQKIGVNEAEEMSPAFVEKVFSIYSGLPPIIVSPSVTKPVAEVREWFEDRVIGQQAAIAAVVEMIALYKSGLHDPDRPIGSFLFVGPTGVGKTELARALARFLFGTESRLLRFDLSEYKDYHAFQMLIGDPSHPKRPARLVDPVRAKPFQVVLLDEIEKAHSNVWDLLLQVLDEGRLTPATGKPVNFRNTIIIATSNVGARERARSGIGFVADTADAGADRMRKALETAFRPEFINRFQHVVQFHALGKDDVRLIANMELARIFERQGIAGRQIHVDIAEKVMDLVVDLGYDEQYGARALRRAVQQNITMPIATLLLERQVADGSIVRLSRRKDAVTVAVVDTDESKAHKAEARPIRTPLGAAATRSDLARLLGQLRDRRDALIRELDESSFVERLETLDKQTQRPGFWNASADMAQVVSEMELIRATLRKIESFRSRDSDIREWLDRAASRDERQRIAEELGHYDAELTSATRELLIMPDNAAYDAIIELRPLGGASGEAIQLFKIYRDWAAKRGFAMDMICEPQVVTEPIVFGVRGLYAFGYLRLESGHHRFRGAERNKVVKVRVVPWTDIAGDVDLAQQRALKKTGVLGGRIRSRIAIAESELVIQNERTLIENRSFAELVVPSWQASHDADDRVIRRYDSDPFLLRDHLTGMSIGKRDVLRPDGFHDLLCRRAVAEAGSR